MKSLKFRHHLAEEILAGRKTTTWWLFDDKELSDGDSIELLEWENGSKIAEAKIIAVKEKKLRDITEADFEGHEKYENPEVMLKHYKEYYGEKVTMDTPVKIIGFKLDK